MIKRQKAIKDSKIILFRKKYKTRDSGNTNKLILLKTNKLKQT